MNRPNRGFTLIELLIVMVIIGILIAFIIKASMGGVRRAEEKATIALIAKLEQAMTDRVDALTTYQADPTPFHYALGAMYNSGAPVDPVTGFRSIASVQRAQAIAQFDYLRAQLPDVFAVQNDSPDGTTSGQYPFNFAGASATVPIGSDNGVNGTIAGAYGAAFEIAGGIYKQLGYHPKGYDGSDNDGDGAIDDAKEGIGNLSAAEQAVVLQRLKKHTHKTARSEMLYAILVEGGGVYGSAFDKDDFTSKEVQDTDGDGLMEFVDAWGEPLQFYRWPILYRSDSQKGYPDTAKLTQDAGVTGTHPGPYTAVSSGSFAVSYESREQNPIDPNQTLLAPAWWGSGFNDAVPTVIGTNNGTISGQAMKFMSFFGPCLVDPTALNAGAASQTFWDRSTSTDTGYYQRRAFYSRFLILSGGPDKIPGTAQLGVDYAGIDDRSTIEIPGGTSSTRDGSGVLVNISVPHLLLESQGGKVDLNRDTLGKLTLPTPFPANGRNDTNSQLEYYSQDDISSQNLQSTGGVLQ
ncbi:type II secretion system protein [Singulisphaera acidiphila]|uniref:Prepilin-type N-terminal cleavage/methylation domain-containing protein n=1 Tax=Singulisphaera acidiphila (strain ATCC BAA-1392 / DSM 18658 / VKM B-2454 / MOB10) TaxID=886293 RepID=L0DHU2_SINAD|nr:prepilin-type N-terminal cleavage/methylation domain-containing protein [Singulisphaera acidiphila]AGA28410.1 prepilin-type N-terminal cleavage/methylation domain-containing protein [Singulisphaera acidiphila DSM 18658]